MINAYLLVALFFCHFLADFTQLSRPYMLEDKRVGKIGFGIFAHALVHAALMGIVIAIYCAEWLWLLTFFQFGTHFWIDVLKGRMNVWFPIVRDTSKYPHWILFGFDQFLHSVVIIIMANIATQSYLMHHQ